MVAKKFNIKFKFNESFPINSLSLMRGILVIDENKIKNWHGFCNNTGLANMAKFQTKKK